MLLEPMRLELTEPEPTEPESMRLIEQTTNPSVCGLSACLDLEEADPLIQLLNDVGELGGIVVDALGRGHVLH